MLYFEDFRVGDVREFGNRLVAADEIIAFATEFDPQPFHIDLKDAERSEFKGLIASGWHTVSMTCRMFVDNYMGDTALIGGVGADEIRWLKPVRPGDALNVRATVVGAKRSQSKPDRGSVSIRLETMNETGDTVLTLTVIALLRVQA
jgi:acyl dehydratase